MRLFTVLLFVIGITTTSFAQILTPVKWDTQYKQINDTEFDLIFTAKIDAGWSIYSQYLESDDGPVRTSFEWDSGDHFQLLGKNEESGDRSEGYDKLFDMNVIKFKKKAVFTQRVKATDLSKAISGYLTFMTCDDKRCLPPTDVDFEFKLEKAATDSGAVETSKEREKTQEPSNASIADQPKSSIGTPPSKESTTSNDTKEEAPTASTDPTSEDDTGAGNSGELITTGWEGSVKKKGNGEYELVYQATIQDKWYLYSQVQENEDGPFPAEFNFDPGDHYELVGKVEESDNRFNVYDPVFEMNVNKFKNTATFTQALKINDPAKGVSGYFSYQTCDDKQCIKYDTDFFAMPSNGKFYIGKEATKLIDAANAANESEDLAGGTTGPKRTDGNVIDQKVEAIQATYKEPVGDCGGGGQDDKSWIWAFIFGFGGGLFALITPCVFPMIPLTVSFFTKGSDSRAAGIRNGLIYGFSIIIIYVALGLLITVLFGPEALNRLSTHWLSNTLFFIVFVVFAISFFGYFEITLPSSLANKSDQMADKGGLIGIFFMAATLAIVSFSCTGPIVGTALVQTASNPVGPFFVMLGFSTALALPFGLFAAFPAWLNSLPSSGSWMTNVKVVLGFVELALALKFLSVADYTFHWGILKYEVFMALWVIIAAAMTLYLFGFIRFPHDSKVTKLSPTRTTFAVLSLALTIWLASGFRYDDVTKSYTPPGLMSGLAPPSIYNFFLPKPEVDADLKKKYPSFTKCANNLDCFKDYYEGMAYAKEKEMPVLLDFTGFGCVNCRKTEDFIWVRPPIRDNIDQNFVLISLYVDDPTKLDEVLVSASRQNKIRNIGNKWADFQIVNFEGNAQPLYVLMSPDEKVLAHPRPYVEGWEGYDEFLNCGLETFRAYKKGQIGLKAE